MSEIKVKWQMLSHKRFVANVEGYVINVISGAAYGSCFWNIVKDGNIVDSCFYYKPVNGELAGKAAAEKSIRNILTTPSTSGK